MKVAVAVLFVALVSVSLAAGRADRRGDIWCQPRSNDGRVAPASQSRTLGGIEATEEVQRLLDKVRESLGGRARLMAVRSLIIESARTYPGAAPYRSTYRILLPDQYQQRTPRVMFTLDGPEYWQSPDPGDQARVLARANTLSWFAETCLVLLIRAPAQMPVRATATTRAGDGVLSVELIGSEDFARTLEVDPATFRPKAFSYLAQASQGGTVMTVTRRVAFEEFTEIGGIRFPTRMTDSYGSTKATIEHNTIRVNEDVTPADFRKQ